MKAKRVTREQERALIERAQAGDMEARNELILCHYPYLIRRAKRFLGGLRGRAEIQDLIQEAVAGLLVALDRFDLGAGVLFLSYATYWIDVHLRVYRNCNRCLVYVPRDLVELLVSEHAGRAGGAYTRKAFGEKNVRQARRVMNAPVHSLGPDRRAGSGLDVADPSGSIPEDVDTRADAEALMDLARTAVDRRVIVMRFGLDGNNPRSFPDIAAELGICATTAKQALVRLRRAATGQDHLPGGLKMRREYFRPKTVRA